VETVERKLTGSSPLRVLPLYRCMENKNTKSRYSLHGSLQNVQAGTMKEGGMSH
jgi:hypothetical protein